MSSITVSLPRVVRKSTVYIKNTHTRTHTFVGGNNPVKHKSAFCVSGSAGDVQTCLPLLREVWWVGGEQPSQSPTWNLTKVQPSWPLLFCYRTSGPEIRPSTLEWPQGSSGPRDPMLWPWKGRKGSQPGSPRPQRRPRSSEPRHEAAGRYPPGFKGLQVEWLSLEGFRDLTRDLWTGSLTVLGGCSGTLGALEVLDGRFQGFGCFASQRGADPEFEAIAPKRGPKLADLEPNLVRLFWGKLDLRARKPLDFPKSKSQDPNQCQSRLKKAIALVNRSGIPTSPLNCE